MTKRYYQSDIDGKLSELIKNDKSRFMNKTDYKEYVGTGPFEDRKGLIYKINLPEGFVSVTLSATDNDPSRPIVVVDIRRHEIKFKREFTEGTYDDKYQLAYIIYREICNRIDSNKSTDDITSEFDLIEVQ